jgi:hypothetical protein
VIDDIEFIMRPSENDDEIIVSVQSRSANASCHMRFTPETFTIQKVTEVLRSMKESLVYQVENDLLAKVP